MNAPTRFDGAALVCPCCHRPLPQRRGVASLAFAAAEAVYGFTVLQLRGDSRRGDLSKARALVVWALRTLGEPVSYPVIGRMLAKDHSSMVAAHRRAIKLRLTDQEFALACRAMAIAQQTEIEEAGDGVR